jgi:TonB-linked SusC/RagA family outer membrane protein
MKISYVRKFCLILMMAGTIAVNAQKVSFSGERVTLQKAFEKIESVSKYKFQYNATQLNLGKMVTLDQKNADVLQVVNQILEGTGYSYKIKGNYLIILPAKEIENVNQNSNRHKVTGLITDEKGEPLIGVTVQTGGGNGTITDMDGRFSLNDVDAKSTLTVSYIGYKTQNLKVGNNTKLSIVMADASHTLDELIVVGYGTMKKSDLTGAVSSVNSDKLVSRGVTSVSEALQGSVPGVNITQSNSRAGGSINIQIRGQASINNEASPLYVIDGVVCSSMDFLNPDDIDRIDILKDASSTAIYGSRASAGVIIITTKGSKGANRASKPTIVYDGYYGVKEVTRMPDFMNAQQFMNFRFARYTTLTNESYEGSSRKGIDADGHPHYEITNGNLGNAFVVRSGASSYKDSKIYELYMDPSFSGYDWKKYVTRTASQQNHFISASGATESINYRLGLGYQDEGNVFKKNDYSRYNIKGSFDAKLSKVFDAGISMNLAYSLTDDFCTDGSYSPYVNAFYFNPFVSAYDSNGNLYVNPGAKAAFDSNSQFTSTVNPLIDLYGNHDVNQKRDFYVMGNVYLRAHISKDLQLTSTFSPNYNHRRLGIFYAKGITDSNPQGSMYYQKNGTNYGSIDNTDRFDWTWDNQVDYHHTWGDHSLNAMGVYSLYQSNTETSSTAGKEISDDRLTYNSLTKSSGDKSIASSYTENSLVSIAARLNYSYKGKYMVTGTLRTDGSSRFADGNKWGWFPSFGVAWRMSEEPWLKRQASWLDNLKMRLSYGVTGNNNVGDYVTQSSASGPTYVVLGGTEVQGYYPNGLVNTALIWEKVKEFDLGFDIGLLQRINLTMDLYNRLSDGQIMSRSVPLETGETSTTCNIGSVENRGIEIGAMFNVIRNKDFKWDVNVNFSRNWNKIKELSNGKVDEVANSWFIGQPLNVLRDYTHTEVITDKGVTMHTINGDKHYTLKELYDRYGKSYRWYEGQIAVNDLNDDGKIDDNDKQIYGCTDPRWTGSLSTTVTYKNFDFSVMLYTKSGFWSRSYFSDLYMKWSDRGNSHLNMDFYIPKGAPVINSETGEIEYAAETHYGSYPYPNNSDTSAGGYFSDKGSAHGEGYQYQKTSFTKVKNITLGYTFSKNLISRIGVNGLRVYINVLNPFCFTNYKGFDPEWASANLQNGGPASVTYQFGVNLKL